MLPTIYIDIFNAKYSGMNVVFRYFRYDAATFYAYYDLHVH